jgi:hypothetical protein
MKKNLTSFLTLCLVLCFSNSSMFAQTTVEIATGTLLTADHHSGPIYRSSAASSYDFCQYAYLYTVSELSAVGLTTGSTISQLAWNKTSSGATVGNASFKIYLKNSSTTSYTTGQTFASLISGLAANYDASTAMPCPRLLFIQEDPSKFIPIGILVP